MVEVADGEALLNKAREIHPDLMVVDLWMPFRDGLSAIREILAEEALRNIPIIVLTGRNREADVIECLEAGADDFMSKPFSPDELLVRVRRLLRKKGQ